MTTYEPRETRAWSTNELHDLVGRYAYISTSGADTEGWVDDAGIGRGGLAWVQYRDGRSTEWNRVSNDVTISVHDAPIF